MAAGVELYMDLSELFEALKKCLYETPQGNIKQESGDSTTQIEDPVKEHFNNIIKKIDEHTPKEKEGDVYIKLIAMKASIIYEQAKLKLAKGSIGESQELLQQTLEVIGDLKKHKQMRFLNLRVVNHLAYLYSRNGELESARDLLENVIAEEVDTDILVFSTEELFKNAKLNNEEGVSKLNKLMVNNMQMLAWVYGKAGMHDLHTLTQHKALQRQLDTGDGEPLQWACRCCRLATLFLTECQWVHARYHLAAAGMILDRLGSESTEDQELKQGKADLARAWIHYGLHLFSVSKKTILDRIYFNEETISEDEMAPEEESLPDEYQFRGMIVNPPDIPAVQIITTEQARNLFLNTHTWLKQARVFYTLRDYPLHYVNAVLDLSELYRFLAFYEADLDSQYNVQKRRADTLETLTTILREIRPTCYVSVSVELLRELTEVQIELMGINLKRLYMAENSMENEDSIRRRIGAVSDLHSKLESLGNMVGNSTLDIQGSYSESEMLVDAAEVMEDGEPVEITTEAVEDTDQANISECDSPEEDIEEAGANLTENENNLSASDTVNSLPSTSNDVPETVV